MKNVHQLPRPDQLESVATPGHFFYLANSFKLFCRPRYVKTGDFKRFNELVSTSSLKGEIAKNLGHRKLR